MDSRQPDGTVGARVAKSRSGRFERKWKERGAREQKARRQGVKNILSPRATALF